MKTIIPLEEFGRKESVMFFKDFYNPYVTVTCPMDASNCMTHAKNKGIKIFYAYLHAILRAVNDVEELHYRFDKDGNIVYHDVIDVLTPIRVPGLDHFVTLRFPYSKDKEVFLSDIEKKLAINNESSGYNTEASLEEFDVVLVSAVPNLPFTSISCTQRRLNGNDFPLISVGQLGSDGKMPVALSAHHGFVDGEHFAKFYELLQLYLNGE